MQFSMFRQCLQKTTRSKYDHLPFEEIYPPRDKHYVNLRILEASFKKRVEYIMMKHFVGLINKIN